MEGTSVSFGDYMDMKCGISSAVEDQSVGNGVMVSSKFGNYNVPPTAKPIIQEESIIRPVLKPKPILKPVRPPTPSVHTLSRYSASAAADDSFCAAKPSQFSDLTSNQSGIKTRSSNFGLVRPVIQDSQYRCCSIGEECFEGITSSVHRQSLGEYNRLLLDELNRKMNMIAINIEMQNKKIEEIRRVCMVEGSRQHSNSIENSYSKKSLQLPNQTTDTLLSSTNLFTNKQTKEKKLPPQKYKRTEVNTYRSFENLFDPTMPRQSPTKGKTSFFGKHFISCVLPVKNS